MLILLFWLGPLAAALPATEDARLPPCCRRHGAHHCAMAMQMASQAASGKPTVTSPATCPLFPSNSDVPNAPVEALTVDLVSLPVLLAQTYPPAAGRAAARLSQIRTCAGRGPPASALA